MRSPRFLMSLAGFAAIALWSSTTGVARVLTESLGSLTTGAVIFLLAGAMGCGLLAARPPQRAALRQLPLHYLFGCGALFVLYMVCLYAAIGLATGREQVLEVNVINYLWPGLTLLFSVPILRKRPRAILPLGMLLAFAGVVLAIWPQEGPDLASLQADLRENAWPYLLALVAAVTWALYSNLSRRWAGLARGSAVPLFILAAGIVMAVIALARGERPRWTPGLIGPIAFTAIGPALLAYVLWDLAVRRGDVTLVASAAYATPLLSTGIACGLLNVLPPASLWAACGLVVAGAVVCRLGLRDSPEAP